MEAFALVALLMVVVVKAFAIHRLNTLEAQIRMILVEETEVSERLHETESVFRQLEQESKSLQQENKHLENDRDLASLEITKLGGTPITLEQMVEQLTPKPQPAQAPPQESVQSTSENASPDPASQPAAAGPDILERKTPEAPEHTQPTSPDELGSPRQRILVVDDNNELRGLLNQALSPDYDVIEAPDGFEALTMILKEKQIYDLIITDLKMPKINGITLVEHLPDATPVIIISGFIENPAFKKSLSALPTAIVLKKPFKVSVLRETVQKALLPEPTP